MEEIYTYLMGKVKKVAYEVLGTRREKRKGGNDFPEDVLKCI